MNEAVKRVFKKEIEESVLEALSSLVRKGLLSVTDAAKEAGLSPTEFQSRMVQSKTV